ncbi:MAG TPA: peptidoglycan editing factor PgeF [Gammaproteobacteria bacterium]|nr:peptidoglycan editing factor PgeF [Gammaproteobacteria bacterium]
MQKYIDATWPAPKNIRALTSLREAELKDLNLPTDPFWIKQTHGNAVVRIDQAQQTPSLPEADASVSFTSNTVCMVRTADCLPVFLCDQQGTQVAVVHCGWRSLAANILENTCKQFTAPLQGCMVWLGPAIGPQAFEVGKDVLDGFAAHGWSQEQLASGFKPHTPGKWLGDLYTLARLTLQQQGIPAENIYGGEWCTYSDPARFYSYRRSRDAGRMFNLIWIAD